MTTRSVFITGGTGYMGRALIAELLLRGHAVRALVRRGSERKLPSGCEAIIGDPLDQTSFAQEVQSSDTFVQLVGVPRPSPAKARQFRERSCFGASIGGRRRSGARRALRLRERRSSGPGDEGIHSRALGN